jgi:hypothetical protein
VSFVPISRLLTIAMAGVVCFLLLIPMALSRHHVTLAYFIGAVYVAYLAVNVVLWQRMRPRA